MWNGRDVNKRIREALAKGRYLKSAALVLITSLTFEILAPGFSYADGKLQAQNTERVPAVDAAGDSRKELKSTELSAAEIVDGAIRQIEKSPTVRYKVHSRPSGWSESGWIVGTLVDAKPDTFAIKTIGGMRHVRLTSIRKFGVSAGRYRNTANGMKAGLILGLAILVPVAIADATLSDGHERWIATQILALRVSLPIFLVTTLAGTAIKSHKWIDVTPHRLLDLYVAPTRDRGLRAGLSFRF